MMTELPGIMIVGERVYLDVTRLDPAQRLLKAHRAMAALGDSPFKNVAVCSGGLADEIRVAFESEKGFFGR
jgi:hypothetical protein